MTSTPLHTVQVEPGLRASAVRSVPGTLPLFATHFPRLPLLPGALLLQSAAEVAAMALPPCPGGWRLRAVERARWRHPVRPGDQVQLVAEVTGRDGEDVGHLRVTASAGGRTVADVRRMTLVRRVPGIHEGEENR